MGEINLDQTEKELIMCALASAITQHDAADAHGALEVLYDKLQVGWEMFEFNTVARLMSIRAYQQSINDGGISRIQMY